MKSGSRCGRGGSAGRSRRWSLVAGGLLAITFDIRNESSAVRPVPREAVGDGRRRQAADIPLSPPAGPDKEVARCVSARRSRLRARGCGTDVGDNPPRAPSATR